MLELSVKQAISRFLSQQSQIVAASVIAISGSSPHRDGLSLVMNKMGETAGAISGGCVDGEIIEACEQVHKTNQPMFLEFGPDLNVLGSAGLICGGKIAVWVYVLPTPIAQRLISNAESGDNLLLSRNGNTLEINITNMNAMNSECKFFEPINRREILLIIGDSAFTDMLCRMAHLLNYEVIVCEPRPRFAKSILSADAVDENWPNECIEKMIAQNQLNNSSVIIVCTHDRKFDEPALCAALDSPAGFIGAFGSRKTISDRSARLRAAGISEHDISRIRSPIGLDLGGKTAAETAVSVFAEIIAFKNKRSGKSLTEITGAIHG